MILDHSELKMTGPNFASCFLLDQSPKWASTAKYMAENVLPTANVDAEEMSCQSPRIFYSDYFKLQDLSHVAPRKFFSLFI